MRCDHYIIQLVISHEKIISWGRKLQAYEDWEHSTYYPGECSED